MLLLIIFIVFIVIHLLIFLQILFVLPVLLFLVEYLCSFNLTIYFEYFQKLIINYLVDCFSPRHFLQYLLLLNYFISIMNYLLIFYLLLFQLFFILFFIIEFNFQHCLSKQDYFQHFILNQLSIYLLLRF